MITKDIAYYKYRSEQLDMKKTNYLPIWDELAVFCDPRNAYFRVKRTNGDLSQLIPKTDDTFQLHLPAYSAIMNSMLTPQAYIWHNFKFFQPQLQRDFGDWLSSESEMLYNLRYSAKSGFLSAIIEAYVSLVVYGHCIVFIKPNKKTHRVVYQALPIREFSIEKNEMGYIDTFFRTVEMKYKNLIRLFPKYMPDKYKDATDLKWHDKTMELLHVVEPSDKSPNTWTSTYIDKTDNVIIEQTEMKYCPYICARAAVFPSSDDPYGFSQAMNILPSIKMLNSLQFNYIKQSDYTGQPTLLTGTDIIDPTKVNASGSIVEGGIDDQGHPMVAPLNVSANLQTLDYQIKMLQDKIKQALYINFFASFSETQSRSATDAMLKANEKANMIAPNGDRIGRELLIPMIEAELIIYEEMDMLPPAPINLPPVEFDIVLDSPLLKGQRMDGINNIMTLMQNIGLIGQFDPTAIDTINADGAIRAMQDIMNIPSGVVHSPEVKEAITERKQAELKAQQQMAEIPAMADAVKTLADANATMGAA
jgi:hypothetical protein